MKLWSMRRFLSILVFRFSNSLLTKVRFSKQIVLSLEMSLIDEIISFHILLNKVLIFLLWKKTKADETSKIGRLKKILYF